MNENLNSYDEARQFFLNSIQHHNIGEVILFHDQRITVEKLMNEVAEECGRTLIDKDLSTLNVNELHAYKTDGIPPVWLKQAMDGVNPKGYIVYLREFHATSDRIQTDVLNIMIKKEIEGIPFPANTLIVLGVRKEDEAAECLTHTHVVKFYR
jgi:hypothetical protein